MKHMFAAIAALSISAGVFAADAANPTNESRIAPAAPAHGTGTAHTMSERGGMGSMGSMGSSEVRTPYGNVSAVHSNEATIFMDSPAPAPMSRHTMEQTNELKLGPAAPAHGPGAAKTSR